MHTIIFLLTRAFYFKQYHFAVLLCSPPASQWPRPSVSEDLLFHLGCHFFSVLGWLGYPLQKPLSGRKNGIHAWAILTWEISRSPVDSCLDCMVREVTIPTRIYSANRSQPSPGAGVRCRAKWVAHPRASQVVFFLCIFLRNFCIQTLAPHGTLSVMMIPWWS